MKTNILRTAAAAGLTALVIGTAAAQTSVSKPVGYETITVPNGFSYAGLRLHEAPVVSDQALASVAGATVTAADGIVDALDADTTYLMEVTSGDAVGAVVVIESFDAAADSMVLSDDLSANLFDGDTFSIRPAATLASVFGAANSAGLDAGNGGPNGADVVYIPNGDGFDRYYYDSFNTTSFDATWADASNNLPVTASDVAIVYTDGLVMLGAGTADNTFTVSGSVKLTDTAVVLADGFNYLSSVFPVGSSLGSAFGASNSSGLAAGSGGPNGADVIYIPNGGDFDRYYYDSFNTTTFGATWADAEDNSPVEDPTTVSFDDASGIIVLHPGATVSTLITAPEFYGEL